MVEQILGLNLRGANYRRAMEQWIPILVRDATEAYEREGKLTPLAISQIAVRRGLPIKTTFEFLEHAELIAYGSWERLANRGFTDKKAREAVAEAELQLVDESISEDY